MQRPRLHPLGWARFLLTDGLDRESLVEGLTDGDGIEEDALSYFNVRIVSPCSPLVEGPNSGTGGVVGEYDFPAWLDAVECWFGVEGSRCMYFHCW